MIRTVLTRRRLERERTRAFVSAIRLSAWDTPEQAYAAAAAIDAQRDDAQPLPMSLVTLLVTP